MSEIIIVEEDPEVVFILQGDGPQGPQGPTGATGAQGPAGPKGDPGAQGIQGPAGGTIDGDVGFSNLHGPTADTGDDFRIILLSDGTVRAVPSAAVPPALPENMVVTARLSSVGIAWDVAARAANYVVFRDGVAVKTTPSLSYRDLDIEAGETYQYQVQAVDQYGQRSAKTTAVSGFVDPSLNVAPSVTVRAWPPTYPTNGRSYLRVNAGDLNAQELELALEVSAGSIAATDDPSVWIYTP